VAVLEEGTHLLVHLVRLFVTATQKGPDTGVHRDDSNSSIASGRIYCALIVYLRYPSAHRPASI
jgi:hypothetical protein